MAMKIKSIQEAEMELHPIQYGGQQIEIGYGLSFAMCNAEMVYLEREDGIYWTTCASIH